jgi:hypothetical protein
MPPSSAAHPDAGEWCAGSRWGGVRYLIGQFRRIRVTSEPACHNARVTAHPAGYPPPRPQYAPVPAPWRPPRWIPGFLASAAFILAAGATVWGSFEKIQTYRDEVPRGTGGNQVFGYTLYWWKLDQTGPAAAQGTSSSTGVLLAVSAGVLAIAAFLGASAFANRKAGIVSATRVSAALGVGLLTGAVSVRLLDALRALSTVNDRNVIQGETLTFQIGLGVWLPGGAAVLALVGAILTWTRPKGTRVEPDTPRMGVPMPYPPQFPTPQYGAPPPQQVGHYQPYQTPPQGLPKSYSQPQPPYPQAQPVYPQQPAPAPAAQAVEAPTPAPPDPEPPAEEARPGEQADSPGN